MKKKVLVSFVILFFIFSVISTANHIAKGAQGVKKFTLLAQNGRPPNAFAPTRTLRYEVAPYCDQHHCPPGSSGAPSTDCSLPPYGYNAACCREDLNNCHCVPCDNNMCGCSGEDCTLMGGTCSWYNVPSPNPNGIICTCLYLPTPAPTSTPCPYNCGDSCPVSTYCKPSDCTCQPCNTENCGGPGWKCKTSELFCDTTTSPCTCKVPCGASSWSTCNGGACIGGLTCTLLKLGTFIPPTDATCGCQ